MTSERVNSDGPKCVPTSISRAVSHFPAASQQFCSVVLTALHEIKTFYPSCSSVSPLPVCLFISFNVDVHGRLADVIFI